MAGIGTVAIFVGVFGFMGRCAVPGAPCPSPSPNEIAAYGGLVVLVIGIALLIRAGSRGTFAGWVAAAIASAPATWFTYEVVRQEGCPLLGEDGSAARACLSSFGEMTAPVVTAVVAGFIVIVGWLRRRGRAARATTAAP